MKLLGLAALAFGITACGRSALGPDLDVGGDGAADDASGSPEQDGANGGGSSGDASVADGQSADVPIFTTDGATDGQTGPDAAPGSCGPATCDGCCEGTSCIELGQTSPSQCGFAGLACSVCNTGGMCLKGACVYPRPNCGPANCPGCCFDANNCSDGTAQDACGFGGQACEGCGPEANLMNCLPQQGGGGSCHATCGPGSGCHGCCNGATCELGQSTSACGANGAPCAGCANGEICAVQGAGAGGMCQEPCSPSTCPGCCEGEVCAVGNQDIACGTGGGACADCTAQSYLCVQGACQP